MCVPKDDYFSPERKREQIKNIGSKFSYEHNSDGTSKYQLGNKEGAGGVIIGTLAENGLPCAIRLCNANDCDVKNSMKDLEVLKITEKNRHENIIRYFDKVELKTQT